MQTTQDNRASACFDISYRRVDTSGRILGVCRAENIDNQYLCLTPTYIPVAVKLTSITEKREYNIYVEVQSYTPEVKITLGNLLNFTKNVQEVAAITGTTIAYTPLTLRYIAKTN